MRYLDKYPNCIGCPVKKWCGTMISCIRLCKNYRENKEETKMNYEERYKKALKVIEELYTLLRYQSSSDALLTCQTIEKAFPELLESEDEKIRKEILDFFNQFENGKYRGVDITPWIAWLEKQGEQKPADKVESKFKAGDWIVCFDEEEGETSIPEKVVDFFGNKVRLIDTYGVSMICPKSVLKQYHLWTIKDAKD